MKASVRPELDSATFHSLCQLITSTSGISLSEKKRQMVAGRLARRLRELRLGSYRDYLELVRRDGSGRELQVVLDAISTNVTRFFREAEQLDYMAESVSRRRLQRGDTLRVWSAASSTGQEPYSIAMLLTDLLDPGVELRILATDISTTAVERTCEGLYDRSELSHVPPRLRHRFFRSESGSGRAPTAGHVRVAPELRRVVHAAHLNLRKTPYPMRRPFDFIFCRNVMIYFSREVRALILRELRRLLAADGHLIIGTTESLVGIDAGLRRVAGSIYRPVAGGRS